MKVNAKLVIMKSIYGNRNLPFIHTRPEEIHVEPEDRMKQPNELGNIKQNKNSTPANET